MESVQTQNNTFQEIPLNQIDPPAVDDRLEISEEAVSELANSIHVQGLLQPIVVAKRGDRYEIVAGHRRYLAHKRLHKKTILSRVTEYNASATALARASENLQREELSPIEEALIYQRLADDFNMNYAEIAKTTGRSPAIVKRRFDLLKMDDKFRRALHAGKISVGAADSLWVCPDESYRDYLLEMAIDHGITVAIARQWVQDYEKASRQPSNDIAGGGGVPSVLEPTVVYMPCDLCRGPVELPKITELRCCPECAATIKANM